MRKMFGALVIVMATMGGFVGEWLLSPSIATVHAGMVKGTIDVRADAVGQSVHASTLTCQTLYENESPVPLNLLILNTGSATLDDLSVNITPSKTETEPGPNDPMSGNPTTIEVNYYDFESNFDNNGDYSIAAGQSIPLTISPKSGLEIGEYQTTITVVSTNTISFTVKVRVVPSILVSFSGEGGSISNEVDGHVLVATNEMTGVHTATLNFTIQPGFYVKTITIDDVLTQYNQSHTFPNSAFVIPNVTESTTVHVLFAPKIFSVTITHTGSGSTNPGASTFDMAFNDSPTNITISPAVGYYLSVITVSHEGIVEGVPTTVTEDVVRTYGRDVTVVPYVLSGGVEYDRTINFVFSQKQYTITINTTGSGGAMHDDQPYFEPFVFNYGANAVIYFTASNGYYLSACQIDGTNYSTSQSTPYLSHTFSNIQNDHEITLVFLIKTYLVTATVNNQSAGSINGQSTISQTINHGQTFTVTGIVPQSAYYISKIHNTTYDQPGRGDNVAPTDWAITNITEPTNITIYFSIRVYIVTVVITTITGLNNEQTTGGTSSVVGTNNVNHNNGLTIPLSPINGYYAWRIENESTIIEYDQPDKSQANNPSPSQYLSGSITADKTITITFAKRTYSVFVTINNGNGSTTLNTTSAGNTVEWGQNLAIPLTPNEGYFVKQIQHTVNGIMNVLNYVQINREGTVFSSYSVDDITMDVTLVITFQIMTFNITVIDYTDVIGGSPLVNQRFVTYPEGAVNYGGNFVVNFNHHEGINLGYYVSQVQVNNDTPEQRAKGASNPFGNHIFTNVTGDQTLKIWYTRYRYSIHISINSQTPYGQLYDGNGDLISNGVGGVDADYGEEITFRFSPNEGYYVSVLTLKLGTDTVGNPVPNVSQATDVKFYTFTTTEDTSPEIFNQTLVVSFAKKKFSIVVQQQSLAGHNANGTVSPATATDPDANPIYWGDSYNITYVPNGTHRVYSIAINGEIEYGPYALGQNPPAGGITVQNIKSNTVVMVTFAESSIFITWEIVDKVGDVTTSPGTHGTVSYASTSPQSPIQGNQTVTLNIVPAENWEIHSVLVNGTAQVVGSGEKTFKQQQLSMPTADQHVVVTFSPIMVTLTVNISGGNGTANPVGTTQYAKGSNITVALLPNTGYHVSLINWGSNEAQYVQSDAVTKYPHNASTYQINDDHTITVAFSINHYTVSLPDVGDFFTTNADADRNIPHNGQFSFSITLTQPIPSGWRLKVTNNGTEIQAVETIDDTLYFNITTITAPQGISIVMVEKAAEIIIDPENPDKDGSGAGAGKGSDGGDFLTSPTMFAVYAIVATIIIGLALYLVLTRRKSPEQ